MFLIAGGRPEPLMALRFYAALRESIGMPKQIKENNYNILHLQTEFGLTV
jgi:hypothetical protein